jgi:glycosyltransferase involved in cell wall biosynthesis
LTPLLFIKHKDFNARTVENDIAILNEKFDVKLYEVNTTKGISFFTSLIKQFIFHLCAAGRYKIFFIWFADYHSMLPVFFAKLYGKKCVINIGGYDADEILTGTPKSLKEKFRKFCVSYSVKNASLLLPVSDVIKSYLETEVPPEKCETIYCCVDTVKFPPPESIPQKQNIIITVGGGGAFIKEAKRKRLDFFIELGNEFNKRFPDLNTKFYAIGHNPGTETYKYLEPLIKSGNVELKPATKSVDELIQYYTSASVYMQLSFYEAFGIAQVEAMLYGCIPVSNPGGAIAEVIGDAGFTVKDYDMNKFISVIREIIEGRHEELRKKAKQRAFDNFSLEQRRKKLLKTISTLL